jgi:uncharacterized protein YndB with AHSA1/START domain
MDTKHDKHMSHAIKYLFHINAPREQVYQAITSIDGLSKWWTAESTGDAGKDGVIQFRFGGQGPDMKVADLKLNEQVSWECVASPHGWVGNRLSFMLDENDGKTRVRFAHDGFPAEDDSCAICTFGWGRYMESLRQYCQTGKGEGFGQPDYRK